MIRDYLKAEYPRVVHKGEIGRMAVVDWGYENENCGRRLRELENDKVVEVVYNERHEAQYRYIGIDIPVVKRIEFGGQGKMFANMRSH